MSALALSLCELGRATLSRTRFVALLLLVLLSPHVIWSFSFSFFFFTYASLVKILISLRLPRPSFFFWDIKSPIHTLSLSLFSRKQSLARSSALGLQQYSIFTVILLLLSSWLIEDPLIAISFIPLFVSFFFFGPTWIHNLYFFFFFGSRKNHYIPSALTSEQPGLVLTALKKYY